MNDAELLVPFKDSFGYSQLQARMNACDDRGFETEIETSNLRFEVWPDAQKILAEVMINQHPPRFVVDFRQSRAAFEVFGIVFHNSPALPEQIMRGKAGVALDFLVHQSPCLPVQEFIFTHR